MRFVGGQRLKFLLHQKTPYERRDVRAFFFQGEMSCVEDVESARRTVKFRVETICCLVFIIMFGLVNGFGAVKIALTILFPHWLLQRPCQDFCIHHQLR